MKTLFEIVKIMGNEENSRINADISYFAEVEKSSISALNRANQYLWNFYDFDFKNQTITDDIINSEDFPYPAPIGRIFNVYINNNKKNFYTFYENGTRKISLLDSTNITGSLKIKYQSLCPVKTVDDEVRYNFEKVDDVLNVPEELENLYINALVSKAITYLIADSNDESYLPYENAFKEALTLLINASENHHQPQIIV